MSDRPTTPTMEPEEELNVISRNELARVNNGSEVCSAVVWRLNTWTIVESASKYPAASAAIESGYEDILLIFDFLMHLDRWWPIICGDYDFSTVAREDRV